MLALISVLKRPKYILLATVAAVAMLFFYAWTQVIFITHNLDIWFADIPGLNLAMFLVFAALFGITLSYQVWLRFQPKVCAMGKQSTPGLLGSIVAFFVVQCPACASLGALFLPISAISILTIYSPIINLASIGLLLLTLHLLGAFKPAQTGRG